MVENLCHKVSCGVLCLENNVIKLDYSWLVVLCNGLWSRLAAKQGHQLVNFHFMLKTLILLIEITKLNYDKLKGKQYKRFIHCQQKTFVQ